MGLSQTRPIPRSPDGDKKDWDIALDKTNLQRLYSMINLCIYSDAMSFVSSNFIPKEKSARKAFCYSSVYYATSRGKVGSNHFFGKVLIHEQVCHQTFRAPTSPPSPPSSSSSSLPSILHHFAQIINRETRQHCGSQIYSDEKKRGVKKALPMISSLS